MAKNKYFYANKKRLVGGVNQQEDDFNYFCSPKYAKLIGKKYGLSGEAVETAFNQYFDAMKYFGLTKYIHKDSLRNKIKSFVFQYFSSFGENAGQVIASTDIVNNEIQLRSSIKVGDYESLFHEFNHLISIDNTVRDRWEFDKEEKIYVTGYHITNLDTYNSKYMFFNEGVTELLALRQFSYMKKTISVINESYSTQTAIANSLFLILGDSLFEGYFGCGSFKPIVKAIGEPNSKDSLAVETLKGINTSENDIKALVERISNYEYLDNLNALNEFKEIYFEIIDIMFKKLYLDVINNLNSFNNFKEIKKAVFYSFAEFSKSLFFGASENSIFNISRQDIFLYLTDAYFSMLDEIKNSIEQKDELGFGSLEINDSYEEIFNYFITLNDYGYGIIDYRQKPINVLDKDHVIRLLDINKGNYLRRKHGYNDVAFMKDYDKHKKIEEWLYKEQYKEKFKRPETEEDDALYWIIEGNEEGQGVDAKKRGLQSNKELTL